jgi:CRISPR-associated protein Cas2
MALTREWRIMAGSWSREKANALVRSRTGRQSLYVVAYDIPDDRRRTKLHNRLHDFGFAVQYSVFECLLHPAQRTALGKAIDRIVDPEEDIVAVWRLDDCCSPRRVCLGVAEPVEMPTVDIM